MRSRLIPLSLFLLFLACVMCASSQLFAQYPQPGPVKVYAIKAGKLVDPEKGTTEFNQIILIRGKKH